MAGISSKTGEPLLLGRTLARGQALQLLFQAEALGISVEQVLAGDYALSQGPLDDYAERLARGASACLPELDRIVGDASARWEVSRMPSVDRNLLRVATYELLNVPEVPVAVTIDESVELAKAFGTDDSAGFVNGVLGRIAREQAPEKRAVPEDGPESAPAEPDAAVASRARSLADLAAEDGE